jgi:hypothetical protein
LYKNKAKTTQRMEAILLKIWGKGIVKNTSKTKYGSGF